MSNEQLSGKVQTTRFSAAVGPSMSADLVTALGVLTRIRKCMFAARHGCVVAKCDSADIKAVLLAVAPFRKAMTHIPWSYAVSLVRELTSPNGKRLPTQSTERRSSSEQAAACGSDTVAPGAGDSSVCLNPSNPRAE